MKKRWEEAGNCIYNVKREVYASRCDEKVVVVMVVSNGGVEMSGRKVVNPPVNGE